MAGRKLKSKDFPVLPFFGFLGVVISILGFQYNRHGASLFVHRSNYDLAHSASEWHSILNNKTILLLGGPHRGGTTILWKALDAHPEISGLATTPPDGTDKKRKCGEGILIQDVYSRYGIGVEHLMKSNKAYQNKMLGMGKYALADEKDVHLNENDERVSPENMAKLLNRYHYYWNISKPVLVEKSPPTAVMSRFLQAMYNSGRNDHNALQTKFLFMTRHPIANAYAHQSVLNDAYAIAFDTLMENYLRVHRYLKSDLPYLENDPMLVTLEDFTADPAGYLSKIYTWLGVDSSPETVQDILKNRLQESIISDTNVKYKRRWCNEEQGRHNAIIAQYQPSIENLDLGYDLKGWCGSG